jgi:hypothetical protein
MHTPGPWVVGRTEPTQVWRAPTASRPSGGPLLARTANVVELGALTHDEELANARLIAAAPDLLDALERLLIFADELCRDVGVSTHYPSAERARAAIRRALGDRDS